MPKNLQFLLFTAITISGFWYIGSALTAILLIILTASCYYAICSRHSWHHHSLSTLMLIFFAWLLIVNVSSNIPNVSLMTLPVLACLPVIYLVATNLTTFDNIWRKFQPFLLLSGVILALWGLWQVINQVGSGYPEGPLGDRNAFAAAMNLFWFPAAYLLLSRTKSRIKTIIFSSSLFIISLALFATASRGGIATWLLLMPFFLWTSWRYTQAKGYLASILLISTFAYLVSAKLGIDTNFANRTFDLSHDTSTSARLLMWKSAIQMTWAHPFTGTGWGTFVAIYPAFRSITENTTSGTFAHNDYLQYAAEGGIPAFLLLITLLLSILWQLQRSIKVSNTRAGYESSALLLGTLAIFIHAGLNFIFYYAFMNIIAGLYLARSSLIIDTPHIRTFSALTQISTPIKRLLVVFSFLLLASPFALHLIAQISLTGSQPGLKILNIFAPSINAYDIAKLISAIRPQEGTAQQYMLKSAEASLADSDGIDIPGMNFKRELLNETLALFDQIRSQTNNNPNIGVREVKALLAHHNELPPTIAYTKAQEILSANLKADPYHADSMIELARLQYVEGNRSDAIKTIKWGTQHILSRRDHQLLDIEKLRLYADPKKIPELDVLEKYLRVPHTEQQTPETGIYAMNLSKHIDDRLQALAAEIHAP